jgi:hypothetical protein
MDWIDVSQVRVRWPAFVFGKYIGLRKWEDTIKMDLKVILLEMWVGLMWRRIVPSDRLLCLEDGNGDINKIIFYVIPLKIRI